MNWRERPHVTPHLQTFETNLCIGREILHLHVPIPHTHTPFMVKTRTLIGGGEREEREGYSSEDRM
jgi:hypothetical protein